MDPEAYAVAASSSLRRYFLVASRKRKSTFTPKSVKQIKVD